MKKIVYLFIYLFIVTISLTSCTNDDFVTTGEETNTEIIHEKLTYKQVTERMDNTSKMVFKESAKAAFKENFNLLVNDLKQVNSTTGEGEDVLIDYYYDSVNNNEIYIFTTHPFTGQDDYLEKFVMTIEDGEQKAGYLRYYPTTDFTTDNFTGRIEISNLDRSEVDGTNLENGVVMNNQTNGIQDDCTTTFIITYHMCSHGGGHWIGQECKPPLVNDAHISVKKITDCIRTFTSDILPMPVFIMDINPNRSGGGGGGNSQTTQTNFLNSLDPDVKNWLNENDQVKSVTISYLNSTQYSNLSRITVTQLVTFFENDPVLKDNERLDELIAKQILFTNDYTVAEFINFWNNLTPQEKDVFNQFVNNNLTTSTPQIIKPSKQDFLKWAFNYLIDKHTVTIEQFENWFMMESEGQDFLYDENYWENPNLTFTQQNLPTWANFLAAYPNETSQQLYGVVGGDVAQVQIDYPKQTRNGCALKVSVALNGSGVTIPNIPNQTVRGKLNANGTYNYYFLNAKALNIWMRKTFGVSPSNPNHIRLTAQDGGNKGENFPSLVKNKKGIFSMVSTNPNWASGHADILYLDGTCKAGCHFQDNPPAPIDYIDIWILN